MPAHDLPAHDLPADAVSVERLARDGLQLRVIEPSDHSAFEAWHAADHRGFYDRRPSRELLDELLEYTGRRRTTGVWDATLPEPEVPVATVASWRADQTVPGGATVPTWAIASVTVAPTHRRRGIARALLEAELRTAAAAQLPVASLTVSEATIYGRYGFGPATRLADLTIDTKRAGWRGPAGDGGRVSFVSLDELVAGGRDVFDRARRATPGEMDMDHYAWQLHVGTLSSEDKNNRTLRAVRFDDASGVPQGFAVYKVVEGEDFTAHTVEVRYLRAVTDVAYAALWRFLTELDLVARVHHPSAAVDEPVLWMLRDLRAATVRVRDHNWVRVLDVPAALGARSYSADIDVVIAVDDPLDLASGVFRLRAGAGEPAEVTVANAAPDVVLGIDALSSIYLGGESATVLTRAGRITQRTDGAVARLDTAFHTAVAPYLSFGY